MPEILGGTAGSVTVGGTIVGEVAEWALDIAHSPVMASAFGDEWDRAIAAMKGASGTFTANTDEGDAMQGVLRDAVEDGQSVYLGLWLDSQSRFELSGYLTDESEGVTVDGADTTVFDFVMTGQLTYATLRYALLEDGDNILLENGDDLKLEGV